jgi:6-pyruvoyltetrahydropterin/6-carboxytetrahydropterin synthase
MGIEGMRITVAQSFTFESAHYLKGLGKGNAGIHGHSHEVVITIEGDTEHMRKPWLMEHSKFRKTFKPVIDRLDHSLLNDIMEDTTAEGIAIWIFDEICKLGGSPKHVRLYSVEVRKVGMSAVVYND